MSDKETTTIKVSFTFDIEVGSDLDQELEYLDTKKLISRIRQTVSNHIKERIQEDADFLKDIEVDFLYNEQNKSHQP